MGTTFIVLCILCLLLAVFIALGNGRNFEQAAANAELAKVWVYIAAVILLLGHFWP